MEHILIITIIICSIWSAWLALQSIMSKFHHNKNVLSHTTQLKKYMFVIPAHNEEKGISRTLKAIMNLDYCNSMYSIHVIADRCTDGTAEIAKKMGAWVHERNSQVNGGKGAALGWFFTQNNSLFNHCDVVVIIDADTIVEKNILHHFNHSFIDESVDAIQSYYAPINSHNNKRIKLNSIALELAHHARQAGSQALGATPLLKGNGMAFKTNLIQSMGWETSSVTEDLEYSFHLLLNHKKIVYNEEAVVYGEMAINEKQATVQQQRWEGGRIMLVGKWLPRIFIRSIKELNSKYFLTALDISIPPVTLLGLLIISITLTTYSLTPDLTWLCIAPIIFMILHFFIGLRSRVYRSLNIYTLYYIIKHITTKCKVIYSLITNGLPRYFERTPR